MSRILVTGSSGFVGTALISRLKNDGYKTFSFAIEDGDLNHNEALERFKYEGITHLIHLAGKTYVPESWRKPSDFYQINIMGTITSLEFCRDTGAHMIYVSSYVYGAPEYLPIDEEHAISAYNPYSHSKIIADSTVQFYEKFLNVKTTILRPFNIYGPGQSYNFIIPQIIHMALSPKIKVVEVMDLKPKRDYLYISDFIDVLVLAISGPSGIYNVGSGKSLSVQEIIELVMTISGVTKEIYDRKTSRSNEIFDLYADTTKLFTEYFWKPKIEHNIGLNYCIEYYLKTINH